MPSTLSLDASKKVRELLGDTYETEYHQTETGICCCRKGVMRLSHEKKIPIPNFAELIRLIPKIGKENGWLLKDGKDRSNGLYLHQLGNRAYIHSLVMTGYYLSAASEPIGMQIVEAYLMKILSAPTEEELMAKVREYL